MQYTNKQNCNCLLLLLSLLLYKHLPCVTATATATEAALFVDLFGIRQCVNSWMAGRGGVKALRHRFLYLCVTVTAAITALWSRNGARAGVTQWYPVKGKQECLTSKETEFHDDLRITMNLYILLVCSVLEYGSCIMFSEFSVHKERNLFSTCLGGKFKTSFLF